MQDTPRQALVRQESMQKKCASYLRGILLLLCDKHMVFVPRDVVIRAGKFTHFCLCPFRLVQFAGIHAMHIIIIVTCVWGASEWQQHSHEWRKKKCFIMFFFKFFFYSKLKTLENSCGAHWRRSNSFKWKLFWCAFCTFFLYLCLNMRKNLTKFKCF